MQVELSRKFVELNTIEDTHEVILHEIAHAIHFEETGDMNHSKEWVAVAKRIGSNGNRCLEDHIISPPLKWIARCETCGDSHESGRAGVHACSMCCDNLNDGHYDEKYNLIYELNPKYLTKV